MREGGREGARPGTRLSDVEGSVRMCKPLVTSVVLLISLIVVVRRTEDRMAERLRTGAGWYDVMWRSSRRADRVGCAIGRRDGVKRRRCIRVAKPMAESKRDR